MGITRTISILTLAVVMLTSTLMVPLAYLDFELRRDYIAEVFCVNRDKPEVGCEGKCFLKNRLSQVEGSKAATSSTSRELFQLSFFNPTAAHEPVVQVTFQLATRSTAFLKKAKPLSHITGVFHPPELPDLSL